MKKKYMLIVIVSLLYSHSFAQYSLRHSVFSSGVSSATADSTHRIRSTIGQAMIGRTQADTIIHSVGFWYQTIDLITKIECLSDNLPTQFQLQQNYPNPFNACTTIRFAVPQKCFTRLSLFDVLGREVSVLIEKDMPPGIYKITLDGTLLPSGVYFYKFTSDEFTAVKKLLLLK